ncbi:MAG: hypothetical protein MUF23_17970 [Pirellula sp.]|nr:hypothetical protein [Pirellula sp.]
MSPAEPSNPSEQVASEKDRSNVDRAALAETLVQRSPLLCNSVCNNCIDHRKIVSGKGSVFLLCQSASTPKTWPKYPPQPLSFCPYFRPVTSPRDIDVSDTRGNVAEGG